MMLPIIVLRPLMTVGSIRAFPLWIVTPRTMIPILRSSASLVGTAVTIVMAVLGSLWSCNVNEEWTTKEFCLVEFLLNQFCLCRGLERDEGESLLLEELEFGDVAERAHESDKVSIGHLKTKIPEEEFCMFHT